MVLQKTSLITFYKIIVDMTRRNDKRNNRRNRQRNNGNEEASKFASMMMGAIMGKAFEEVFGKKDDGDSSGIHAEGISNQDITNINNGKASLTKCTIPTDGTAVKLPIPDNLQVFISEDGNPMIRKKIEGDEKKTLDDKEVKPITYDDVIKELYFDKTAYWFSRKDDIGEGKLDYASYEDAVNSTTPAQAKRYAAFNKLQNIAKYLNKGWKPNFKDATQKWFIDKQYFGKYQAKFSYSDNYGIVYFKSEKLANEAIEIMGKESLNDLFSTDW